MGNSMDERLDKKEVGELLELIGRQLKYESGISLLEIGDFIERLKSRKGIGAHFPERYADNLMDEAIYFISQLKSSDNIRDFMEVSYNIPVPYKLGRQILTKLAVGVILTSKTSLNETKLRWEKREKRIGSINPYQIPKEEFREFLLDDALFPSGYSIISFAKRYHIRLPLTKDKKALIGFLMDQLFERPSDSKKIGSWGLDSKKVTSNNDR